MSRIYWKPARTLHELDQAQKLRFHCLSAELGIRIGNETHLERDVSRIDCLSTTEHVLVYEEDRCVGTARVAFPNAEVARCSGTRFGLELEESGVDLSCFYGVRSQIAEISRLFVLRQWHGTAAAARLYEGLYVLSRQRAGRFWVGGVDCKTSSLREAELMRSALALRGRVSACYQVTTAPQCTLLSSNGDAGGGGSLIPTQPERTDQYHPPGVPIAAALMAFIKRLGATCIGRPVLHASFPRYVLPMLVDLAELPEATLRLFDRAQLEPLLPVGGVGGEPLTDAGRLAS